MQQVAELKLSRHLKKKEKKKKCMHDKQKEETENRNN